MLSQINASKGNVLPQPMKQRSLNYQNPLKLWIVKTKCILIYMKPLLVNMNFLSSVHLEYIANTIMLYFIVHCINVLCANSTCLCMSLSACPEMYSH